MRRPSFATVIALIALFVALGGPAHAVDLLRKNSVTSASIKNRSIKVKDLSRGAVRKLTATRNNSITEAKLRNRSITPGKLAIGAVGSPAIADRSVESVDLATGAVGTAQVMDQAIGGSKIADGSLDARDLGRYWGRFQLKEPIRQLDAGECWSKEPVGLAPERAHADISQDLVIVTPDSQWPDEQLSFTVSNSGNLSRFVLTACATVKTTQPVDVGFRYLVINLP